jgi:hypothetical protein
MNAPRVDEKSPAPVPQSEPSVAGVPVRPAWPVVLYGILASAAVLALYAEQSPQLDPWVGKAAAWVFLAFAIGFAAYRAALVAARRYSPFKAFVQVSFAALFFMLLLFPVARGPSRTLRANPLTHHPEAPVRALAAKVIGLEGDRASAAVLIELLGDPSLEVREAAHAALLRLNAGEDLGPQADPWKERFR